MKRFILAVLLLSSPAFAADPAPPAKCATVPDCQKQIDGLNAQVAAVASDDMAMRNIAAGYRSLLTSNEAIEVGDKATNFSPQQLSALANAQASAPPAQTPKK